MTEHWLPVVGWETLYEVSDLGRVRSVPRIHKRDNRIHGGKVLNTTIVRGYPTLSLCDRVNRKEVRTVTLHRLVGEAFLGPLPPGMQTRHLDGNRLNCALENLKYGTGIENCADTVAQGKQVKGEKHPLSKLTAEDVLAIRASKSNFQELARRFGISAEHARRVVLRHVWRHV